MAQLAPAAVPSAINYQGRLSNASGTSQQGNRAMSVKLYDADTAGTLLYSEDLGNVAVDANGVYAFQFGATGTSDTLVTETLATTDGTTLSYQKALSHPPVLPGTVSVTDGTFTWNETTGNPGSPAHATATVVSGFVVGATVTNGGSGYTAPPAVTITGNGTGAAATAAVADGAVTEITITNAGSGYTTGATITLAPPPAPFVVNFTGGMVTVTYNPAPPTGRSITATYRYSTSGISGALAAGEEQWLELTVDGVAQVPRSRILAVPFALSSASVDERSLHESTSALLGMVIDLQTKLVQIQAGATPSTFSADFISDAFTTQSGINNTVLSQATTSLYKNKMYNSAIVVADNQSYDVFTNFLFVKLSTLNNVASLVKEVYGKLQADTQVYIKYLYSDSSTANSATQGGSGSEAWATRIFDNPQPTKLVNSIEIWASKPSGFIGINARVSGIELLEPKPVNLTLNLSSSNHPISAVELHVDAARQNGDSITYSVSDGSTTYSNLKLSGKHVFPSPLAHPATLTILLCPADIVTFNIGATAIRAYTIRVW